MLRFIGHAGVRMTEREMTVDDDGFFVFTEHHAEECGCSMPAGLLLTPEGVEQLAIIGDGGATLGHAVEVLAGLDPDTRVVLGGELGAVDMEQTIVECLLDQLSQLALVEPSRRLDAETYGESLALWLGRWDTWDSIAP